MILEKDNKVRVARQVRPDDICVGSFVAVLCETYEWPEFSCFGGAKEAGSDGVQRVTLVPNETKPPVRIEAVCVPFVFVVDAGGKRQVFDMRRIRLARVSNRFGRSVFAAMSRKKSRKKSHKKGRKNSRKKSRKRGK